MPRKKSVQISKTVVDQNRFLIPRPAHRPVGSTAYKIEYCDLILGMQEEGALPCQLFTALDIAKATFYLWCDKYPEFRAAYETGKPKSEAFWAGLMQKKALEGDDMGVKACIMILNNNFGWGKGESQATTVNNNTINVQGNMQVLQAKSSNELLEVLKADIDYLQLNNVIDVEIIDDAVRSDQQD